MDDKIVRVDVTTGPFGSERTCTQTGVRSRHDVAGEQAVGAVLADHTDNVIVGQVALSSGASDPGENHPVIGVRCDVVLHQYAGDAVGIGCGVSIVAHLYAGSALISGIYLYDAVAVAGDVHARRAVRCDGSEYLADNGTLKIVLRRQNHVVVGRLGIYGSPTPYSIDGGRRPGRRRAKGAVASTERRDGGAVPRLRVDASYRAGPGVGQRYGHVVDNTRQERAAG